MTDTNLAELARLFESPIPDELVEKALAAWFATLSELPDHTPGLTVSERIRRQHKAGIRAALEAVYLRVPKAPTP